MKIKWNNDTAIMYARKCITRTEFAKKYGGGWQYVKRNSLEEAAYSHMGKKLSTREYKPKKWTLSKLKNEALKYSSRSEFEKGSLGAYDAALKRKLIDEVCSHMDNKHIEWTNDKIISISKKYKYVSDFRKNEKKAYAIARYRGIHDKVTKHMIRKRNTKNSFEDVKKEALKYTNKSEFKRKSSYYQTAMRNGWLDRVCDHMGYGISGFDTKKPAKLYYVSINNGQAYKIGITNLSVKERFRQDFKKIDIIKVWDYSIGAEARTQEQKILKRFSYAKWDGVEILKDGNSELFNHDILCLDKHTA